MKPVSVLVVGCGQMGGSHARAYHKSEGFEIVGLVSRGRDSRERLSAELGGYPVFGDPYEAMETTEPEAVSVNTYPNTHAEYARAALERGMHVFVEKPIAGTVADAERVVAAAHRAGRKVVVGYILRHHPAWSKFTDVARTLGRPLVMRMNLNQQSSGAQWQGHKRLMESLPPIVDCGVHYVDVMCQMTRSAPVRVHAMGARLSDEISESMYNYGMLQVVFADGSVGWYEAGWGPMMSETAFFVKDVVGPKGCVSISGGEKLTSKRMEDHTKTNALRVHSADLDAAGEFRRGDEIIDMTDEPSHQELCDREQAFFLRAIREDVDLSGHIHDAVSSLKIVLAADESIRTGALIELD